MLVRSQKDNVAGVKLPVFESYTDGASGAHGKGGGSLAAPRLGLRPHPPLLSPLSHSPGFELTGLSRGGQVIQRCKATWTKAIELLVQLASLQVRPAARFITPRAVVHPTPPIVW